MVFDTTRTFYYQVAGGLSESAPGVMQQALRTLLPSIANGNHRDVSGRDRLSRRTYTYASMPETTKISRTAALRNTPFATADRDAMASGVPAAGQDHRAPSSVAGVNETTESSPNDAQGNLLQETVHRGYTVAAVDAGRTRRFGQLLDGRWAATRDVQHVVVRTPTTTRTYSCAGMPRPNVNDDYECARATSRFEAYDVDGQLTASSDERRERR
jgi:hypothetical protein